MMMSMMFQAKMVREKEKEGDELRANIAESNQESEANIEMKRRQTQNNIKVHMMMTIATMMMVITKFPFSALNGRVLRSRLK